MKTILAGLLAVFFVGSLSGPAASMRNPLGAATAGAQEYYDRAYEQRFSRHQLENLLAPIALYPDPLLAQVLVAATFVEQVEDAAEWTRRHYDPYGIDYQPWDVSVKAVAHYPSVLHRMADRIDWTIALGQAYVEQPGEVMASVQYLRWMAYRAGNLASNHYWEVIPAGEYIEIVPFQPEFIYVPIYEPDVIFIRRGTFVTFGPAFPIGAWLNRDCDWRARRIYYHGWRDGHRWVERSRPHVRVTNVYVNNNFTNVRINRDVVRRDVNVQNLNRFNSVNREANFNNFDRRNLGRDGNFNASNRTIRRDGDNTFRGRSAVEQPATREDRSSPLRQDKSQSLDTRSPRTQEPPAPQGRIDRWSRAQEEKSQPSLQNRAQRTKEERPPEARLRSQPPNNRPQPPQNGFRGEKHDRPAPERGQATPARVQPASSFEDLVRKVK